ncbi:uncharacterized protein [Phyllobates terribilis]|uniref:uncharacterized protein isoform X2 n=1 Tax=Phyllobates terribilis TaxID=111132 RepID=UPI003CCB4A83
MSDPTITESLTKLLCKHGGWLNKDWLNVFMKLPTKQIEQILNDEPQKFPVVGDIVLARNPVRICPKYLKKEEEEKCDKLHLCKEYLLGKCKRQHCSFFHDISSHHNQSVLKVNRISKLNIEEINVLLLQNDNTMLPKVCQCYMLGLCVRGSDCPHPHICDDFTRGECNSCPCKHSHNLMDLGAARLQMSEVSIRNFQMLCEVKCNERLEIMQKARKIDLEMRNPAAIINRRHSKRKNSEDASQRKLPRIQEESAGMPAGPSYSTISALQQKPISIPVMTAESASASPVNVPLNGSSVSQAKPVSFPLQLVDLPDVQPMALTRASRLVDFPSSSVPLEKPVNMSITSPLVPQSFATIMKPNTPPAAGPFTAPSSSHIILPNSPTKGAAVPLNTLVTTSITSSSLHQPIIPYMKPSTSPAAGPSTALSSSSYTRLLNSPMKSPSVSLDKLANSSIAGPSNPQSVGLLSSIPKLCVSQSKSSTTPATITEQVNAPMNGTSVSQAKPVSLPAPVVEFPTMASTRPCRLVDSLSKSPSVHPEKPETTCTASPFNPQSTDTSIKPSTHPKAKTSTVPLSSYTLLVNSPTKCLPYPLEKPETTFTAIQSNPQQIGLSSSTPSLSIYEPTITPVIITGPVITTPVNAPINGHSFYQAKQESTPVPVVNLDSLSKDSSVHFEKPVTTSTVSPPIPQPAFTITNPNNPPVAGPSTSPSSSYNRLINHPTKSPAVPLVKPATISIASPSNPQIDVTFMKPSTPPAAGPSNAPSSSYNRLINYHMEGPSVSLEKPATISIASPSNPQIDVTFMKPSTPPAAGPSTAPSSSYNRLINYPTKSPSVPLEKPATISIASPSNPQTDVTFMKPSTPPAAGPSTAPSSSYNRLINYPTKNPSVPLEKPATISIASPSNPQIDVTFMEPSTPPTAGPSTAPSSSYNRLISYHMEGPSVSLEKPATISIASPSNPQIDVTFMKPSTPPAAGPSTAPSSSYNRLISYHMEGPSVSLEKPATISIASPSNPQIDVTFMKPSTPPTAGPSTAPSSSYNRLINYPTKSPSVPLEKPATISIASPSNPQIDVTFMKPSTPPTAGPSTAPSSSYNRLINYPTKGPSVPLEKPATISIASPSNPQIDVTFMKPSTPPTAGPSTAPSSSYNRLINYPTKGPSVPLEKPATISISSPSNPQIDVTFMEPSTPPTAGPSSAPSSSYNRLINYPTKSPSVPLEKPATISIASPSNPQIDVTFMKPSTPPTAGPSTAPSSSYNRLINYPTKSPSVPLENPVQSSVLSLTAVSVCQTQLKNHVPEICLSNLWKYCNLGSDCPDMHYYLPYRWQIHKGTNWEDIPNMEEVEKCYCNPKVDRVPLIDFLTMRSGDHLVRRLSTVSSVVKPSEYVLTTEWLWYWRDDYGRWTQYGHSNGNQVIVTISSSDLELRYLAGTNATIPFVAGKQIYVINYQDMKQKNIVYKTEKDVRRRPKYLSFDDVKLLKGSTRSAAAKSPLKLGTSSLRTDIYPKTWDPEAMPELGCKKVLVSDTSSEFLTIVSIFSEMVRGHEVKKIWRLQNPTLWQEFQWQKEQMKKVNQGWDVKERHLFHGTDSTHVDAICDQNFDWRICGTHGTQYGQGSYFARHALYSHKFSIPTPSGTRVMFIARVLVGDYITGHPHMKRPPLRPGSSSRYFDSCVNNIIKPSIFVVFEKHQIYPEHLIEYEEEQKIP